MKRLIEFYHYGSKYCLKSGLHLVNLETKWGRIKFFMKNHFAAEMNIFRTVAKTMQPSRIDHL